MLTSARFTRQCPVHGSGWFHPGPAQRRCRNRRVSLRCTRSYESEERESELHFTSATQPNRDIHYQDATNERVLHSVLIGLSKEELKTLGLPVRSNPHGVVCSCRAVEQGVPSRGRPTSDVSSRTGNAVQIGRPCSDNLTNADKRLHSVPQAPQERPDCSSQRTNGRLGVERAFGLGFYSAYRKHTLGFESPRVV